MGLRGWVKRTSRRAQGWAGEINQAGPVTDTNARAGFAPRPVWGPAPGGRAFMPVPPANSLAAGRKEDSGT